MSNYKWQPGEQCKTRDGKDCVILGYSPDGELFWHSWRRGKWSSGRERNTLPQFHPRPPTTKSDFYIRVIHGLVELSVGEELSNITLEFDGDELVGVKLIGGNDDA